MQKSSFLAILLCAAVSFGASHGLSKTAARQASVTGGPHGPHPYALKTVSAQHLVSSGRDYQWAINFPRSGSNDTIHVIAIRAEFNNGQKDTSVSKTGDGLFGMRSGWDQDEWKSYYHDTCYKYDQLPHDARYFAHQLQMVSTYFKKISHGKLTIESTVYPTEDDQASNNQKGYAVPKPVLYYSPGGKKSEETWDNYYQRKTQGLMYFIRDALIAARSAPNSPFAHLTWNAADSSFRDENNHKTVFLIFHAGASYLTNGGKDGASGRDSPADMIDAFVNKPWFSTFKDSLKLSTPGIKVMGASDSMLVSEVMMCSETSNQDRMNWGIQGILVNQIARQLGIPDLFSTSSGESGVGAFCIMDFAGYSAGNGFIPPYPSAFVRAYMGWDDAKNVSIGSLDTNRVKALTTVLDRDAAQATASAGDTTILLVPLNSHEYYLIENRQRNLGDRQLLCHDSTEIGTQSKYVKVIAAYPFNDSLPADIDSTSGDASNVILKVKNNDVSLPASGILVWHVDENIIRDRLSQDMVNADSVYRGVSLVEADGVQDIGVAFSNAFYQAVFYDYGGAEDVFPHTTRKADPDTVFGVSGFGPHTAPSTKCNDGGHSYLKLDFFPYDAAVKTEVMAVRDYIDTNYCDSVFKVKATWDYQVPGWPKLAAPEGYFDPVTADADSAAGGRELFLLSRSGRLYGWSTDQTTGGITYGQRKIAYTRLGVRGDTLRNVDTVQCIDSIGGVFTMPSAIGNKVYIPSTSDSGIRVLAAVSPTGATWNTIKVGAVPSSSVCGYNGDSLWAMGCANGQIAFGKRQAAAGSLSLPTASPVCALAALREHSATIAAIQNDGTLSLCTAGMPKPDTSIKIDTSAVAPFTLVTGDLDRDSASEIVVCDSRHGLWTYKLNMALAPGWEKQPSDWPSAYIDSATQHDAQRLGRAKLPVNGSAPALVDLNRDGHPDIVVGGTNGLYAFNYKGVLIGGWPSYLDNRFWYQRGSILTSPIAVTDPAHKPRVLFSSPTGQNVTFRIAKITTANKSRGMIWYDNGNGGIDSMGSLGAGLIDTLLTIGDSLVTPYITPGGFVDAVQANGKRPIEPPMANNIVLESKWPLSTGSSPATSPMAARVTDGTNQPVDLFVPTVDGWVYRWQLPQDIVPDTLFWPQAGFDNARSFALGVGLLPKIDTATPPITFYSYPNPVKKQQGVDYVTFKYKFSGRATNVRLDILTFTGFSVFSSSAMGNAPLSLTGSYPDYNEFRVPISKLGPSLYRCRMEATINGKKYEKFWKLAVTR